MMNRLAGAGLMTVAGILASGGCSSPSATSTQASNLGSGGDAGASTMDSGDGDAGASTMDSGDGDAGASTMDSGDSGARCRDLSDEANAQFRAVLNQYQTCAADSDCVTINPGGDGECATMCGFRTNTAGAAALPAAAAAACHDFLGAGCVSFGSQCVAEDITNICNAGSCAGWAALMKGQATSFVHGVCEPFEIDFTMELAKTPAPHDIVFTMATPVNGTLYADATCTTPLTGGVLTIPAGASSVAFGFESLAPGQFSFGGTYSPGGGQNPVLVGTGSIAQ